MKLQFQPTRRQQQGMAVIVVVALLGILLVYVGANVRSLSGLGQELKLLERQHLQRWIARAITTSAPALQLPAATTNATHAARQLPR
jgi:hypothetical protein